jgi:crotonobetaine/carnitine-CoA ligase
MFFRNSPTMDERTVGGLLTTRAKELGQQSFLMFQKENFTYRDVDRISNRIANGFLGLGINKGDNVAVMLDNCPELIFAWFGLAKIGALEIPVNTALKGPLLAYILKHSGSKTLVTQPSCLEQVAFVEDEIKGIERILVVGGISENVKGLETSSFKDLMAQNDNPPRVEVYPCDLMAILYTSGTTGASKGAMIPHNCFYCAGEIVSEHMGYTEKDILYTCLPLFHANAQYDTVMPALYFRGKLAIGKRFSASRFWDEIKEYGATEFNGIGAMLSILEKREPRKEDSQNPVRLVYAQPRPENQAAFEQRFGLKLIELYGMTECGCPVTSIPLDGDRPMSCGKVMRGIELKVLNENDEELPPGKVGEFVVRPTEPFRMFLGYYKMPEETLASFCNLWFHTGDLGWKDDEGYFYFTGRKKEAIRRRGENISAQEVEQVLNSHASILGAAVIGVPSELGEEEVKACIVLKAREKLEPEELMKFCEDRLAYFMIPRYLEFKEDLPRTPTGKVEKYKLKEEGITSRTWDREKAGYKLKR